MDQPSRLDENKQTTDRHVPNQQHDALRKVVTESSRSTDKPKGNQKHSLEMAKGVVRQLQPEDSQHALYETIPPVGERYYHMTQTKLDQAQWQEAVLKTVLQFYPEIHLITTLQKSIAKNNVGIRLFSGVRALTSNENEKFPSRVNHVFAREWSSKGSEMQKELQYLKSRLPKNPVEFEKRLASLEPMALSKAEKMVAQWRAKNRLGTDEMPGPDGVTVSMVKTCYRPEVREAIYWEIAEVALQGWVKEDKKNVTHVLQEELKQRRQEAEKKLPKNYGELLARHGEHWFGAQPDDLQRADRLNWESLHLLKI